MHKNLLTFSYLLIMQDSSEIGKSLPFHGQDSNSYVIHLFQCKFKCFLKKEQLEDIQPWDFYNCFNKQ